MKETEQTLLDQIKDQVAKENGDYKYHRSVLNDEFWRIVCERYAEAKAKASCEATLKKASENAKMLTFHKSNCDVFEKHLISAPHASEFLRTAIDKSSINNPSNIVIVS